MYLRTSHAQIQTQWGVIYFFKIAFESYEETYKCLPFNWRTTVMEFILQWFFDSFLNILPFPLIVYITLIFPTLLGEVIPPFL